MCPLSRQRRMIMSDPCTGADNIYPHKFYKPDTYRRIKERVNAQQLDARIREEISEYLAAGKAYRPVRVSYFSDTPYVGVGLSSLWSRLLKLVDCTAVFTNYKASRTASYKHV